MRYYGLRQYDGGTQEIGHEQSPQDYVTALVGVFQQVWRVLRDDGLLFLVLGDSYAGSWGNYAPTGDGTQRPRTEEGRRWRRGAYEGKESWRPASSYLSGDLKNKDLIGIPWMVAFALRAEGWYLRSEIVWQKPNPMPSSVRDRPTVAHEHVFMLAKSELYYYDQMAVAEPVVRASDTERSNGATRNARSVWSVAVAPFSSKKLGMSVEHYAAYPPELIRPMVRAATSEKGVCPTCLAPWRRQVQRQGMVIARSERRDKMGPQGRTQSSGTQVSPAMATTTGWTPTCSCVGAGEPVPATILDPFAGSGTTALVSRQEGRNAILIDINASYLDLSRARLRHELGLFSGVPAEDGT